VDLVLYTTQATQHPYSDQKLTASGKLSHNAMVIVTENMHCTTLIDSVA